MLSALDLGRHTPLLTLLVVISLQVDPLMMTVVVFHIIPRVLFCSVAEAAAGVHVCEDEAGAEQGAP